MINYTTGNLLADKAEVLVNTVNTMGYMGKGIALEFKKAFPFNYCFISTTAKSVRCLSGSYLQ